MRTYDGQRYTVLRLLKTGGGVVELPVVVSEHGVFFYPHGRRHQLAEPITIDGLHFEEPPASGPRRPASRRL